VWHSHKLDHTYVNYVASDHIPVVVEAGPHLGNRKAKKQEKPKSRMENKYENIIHPRCKKRNIKDNNTGKKEHTKLQPIRRETEMGKNNC
tara:strand:- start:113 stop:382 length:270 start_codon:yes stop_codon:yes gene_type:complete